MKAKSSICLLCLALLWAPVLLRAQQVSPTVPWQYQQSFAVGSPTAISQDRNGQVYFLDRNHNLVRLDSLGRPLGTFSPPQRGRIAAVDATNPMKVLLFYDDRQALLLLDRFLRPITHLSLLDLDFEGTAKVAALAADNGFWIFDETALTLHKLDLQLRQTTISTPLNLILDRERFDVRQLSEYQNMVYLLDYNSGIYAFDHLGNYKQKLPFTGLHQVGFRGNELYFVQEGSLHFVNLYTLQKRSIVLPTPNPYVAALAGQGHYFLFTRQQADLYSRP